MFWSAEAWNLSRVLCKKFRVSTQLLVSNVTGFLFPASLIFTCTAFPSSSSCHWFYQSFSKGCARLFSCDSTREAASPCQRTHTEWMDGYSIYYVFIMFFLYFSLTMCLSEHLPLAVEGFVLSQQKQSIRWKAFTEIHQKCLIVSLFKWEKLSVSGFGTSPHMVRFCDGIFLPLLSVLIKQTALSRRTSVQTKAFSKRSGVVWAALKAHNATEQKLSRRIRKKLKY